jgi:tetratricopeptide (TPR) repeat protein
LILNRARLHALEGEWQKASAALDLLEATFPEGLVKGEIKARFLHLKGQVSRSKDKFMETIESHRSAISTYEKLGDNSGIAKEKLHLSKALHNMGEFLEAAQEAIESTGLYEEELDRVGEVYASLQAFRSFTAGGRRMMGKKWLERAREKSRQIGDQRLLTLIELESVLNLEGLPMENHISNFTRETELLKPEDTDIAVKGFLRIARHLEGAPGKENALLRLRCLSSANDLIKGTSNKEGYGRIVKRLGPEEMSERDLLDSKIDLLEQSLSFIDPENKLKDDMMDLARERGYPFINIRDEDIKGGLLKDICFAQETLFHITLQGLEAEEDLPEDLEAMAEDHCHTLLMSGHHFQLIGKRKRARDYYKKCRDVLDLYEKTMRLHPEHVTEWDMRKVKEVVEYNRSQLS